MYRSWLTIIFLDLFVKESPSPRGPAAVIHTLELLPTDLHNLPSPFHTIRIPHLHPALQQFILPASLGDDSIPPEYSPSQSRLTALFQAPRRALSFTVHLQLLAPVASLWGCLPPIVQLVVD